MSGLAKKTVFSGAQPTGQLTIGNYLGALRNWTRMQDEYDCLFCIVDLHALTVRQDPRELRERTLELAALYMACGLDPARVILFIQSHVPAHPELAWILSTFAQMGELERMTQFKEKADRHSHNVNAGLFTYPVLMAADILLYQTHLVPVGADQKQHLELARDIALRCNGLYGDLFRVPEPMIPPEAARVKDLQEPTRKMSKTAAAELARVMILDDADTVMKKFKKAVTDGLGVIRFDEEGQPGVANLLTIWSAATGRTMEEALAHFSHNLYGKLKVETGEAVNAMLDPIRERFQGLREEKTLLSRILVEGAEKAATRAEATMRRVNEAVGLPLCGRRFT